MRRGTKEFYEIIESFEKSVNSGSLGYIPSDFEKDEFSKNTFYQNGAVNTAFICFMHGYAAAKCEYQK